MNPLIEHLKLELQSITQSIEDCDPNNEELLKTLTLLKKRKASEIRSAKITHNREEKATEITREWVNGQIDSPVKFFYKGMCEADTTMFSCDGIAVARREKIGGKTVIFLSESYLSTKVSSKIQSHARDCIDHIYATKHDALRKSLDQLINRTVFILRFNGYDRKCQELIQCAEAGGFHFTNVHDWMNDPNVTLDSVVNTKGFRVNGKSRLRFLPNVAIIESSSGYRWTASKLIELSRRFLQAGETVSMGDTPFRMLGNNLIIDGEPVSLADFRGILMSWMGFNFNPANG